jgi:hypothetical protein
LISPRETASISQSKITCTRAAKKHRNKFIPKKGIIGSTRLINKVLKIPKTTTGTKIPLRHQGSNMYKKMMASKNTASYPKLLKIEIIVSP